MRVWTVSAAVILAATNALAIPYTNLPPPYVDGIVIPLPEPAALPAPTPVAVPQTYAAPVTLIPTPPPAPAPLMAAPAPYVPYIPPAAPTPYVVAETPGVTATAPTPAYTPDEWKLRSNVGVSRSRLKWNIGYGDVGYGPNEPNILSELSWKDISSTELAAGMEYRCGNGWCKRMMLFASLYGDSAYKGKNQDSDYLDDNRTNEFSRSNSSAKKSQLTGSSFAMGYDLGMRGTALGFSLIPQLGYVYNQQTMRMRNGVQTLSDGVYQTTPVGSALTGLDSRYRARWYGFFAGLDARLRLLTRHELRVGGSLTNAQYHGRGTWNLRSDLAQPNSFEDISRGVGRTVTAGYSFWMTPTWELRMDGTYDIWKAVNGDAITHFSDGTSDTIRFNNAIFISQTYTAGLGYKF